MEAQGRDPDASTLRQFEAYHGVDVWTVENGVGSLCLVVWDRAGSGRLALACAPPGIEAELSLAVEPEGGDGFGDWLRAGSVVDFRLRANSVVGPVASEALAQVGADAKLPGLPLVVQGSPLATADHLVMAAYGVGTDAATTISVLATKSNSVPNAVRLTDELVALGPPEWTRQLEARAAIARQTPLVASRELLLLRDHAKPKEAPGAVLRVTARLPFDARVSLARQTGLELAPARLSLWADVVDDFALIVDADAADPGDKANKDAVKRMHASLETLLHALAGEPVIRALGVSTSLTEARFIEQGTWVRAVVAIGPRHLGRAVERARAMLAPAP